MDVAATSAKGSRRLTRRQWVWAAAALLCAALFAGLFGSGLSLAPLGRAAAAADLATAQGEGFTLAEDGSIVVHGTESHIAFEGLSADTANLHLTYRALEGETFPVELTLFLTGDGAMRDGDFLADQLTLAPAAGESETTALLHSNGALGSFRMDFTSVYGQAWAITGLTLNGGGYAFNWGMFALLALALLAVWAVVVFRLYRPAYDDENKRHRWLARGMAALCALVLVAVFLLGAQPGRRGVMWQYDPTLLPEEQVDEYPGTAFYNLLFDAFWNGQLSLRVEPDPALAELSNPYDRSERGDIPTLWDTSYYGGRYYSYFGPGPVVFYYAFYLLTGHQPSPATACAAAGVLTAFLLWAALRQLLLYFKIKPHLMLLMLFIPALVFGSLTAMLVSCADAYAQPYLWAAAGLCGMVWLLYSAAAGAKAGGKNWQRRLCYAGAGLCVVMVAACRPAMVLLCIAFAAPVLLPAFFGLGGGAKPAVSARLLDATSLAVPVLAGAAVLMAYNTARFGSPFEFGQAYQLTVGDMRLQPFRWQPAWLLETLRYYLFQPLALTSRFPFIVMQSGQPVLFGNRFYSDPFFGLLNLSLYWVLFSAPFALRRKAQPATLGQGGAPLWVRRALFAGVVCAGVLLWWVDFSIGNFLYRYLYDASFAFALLAVVLLLWWTVRLEKPGGRYVAACVVCLATAALGLLVVFAGDRHTIYLNSPQGYALLDQIFRLR